MVNIGLFKFGRSIESVIHKISGIGVKVSSVLLFLMILLMAADVVGRYIFSRPIRGTVDFIEAAILFMVYFTVADVAANKEHITVGLITSKLSQHMQAVFECFTSFGSLIIMVLITWRVAVRGIDLILRPRIYTINLEMPLGPFYLAASLGCVLLCLELVVTFSHALAQVLRKKVIPS